MICTMKKSKAEKGDMLCWERAVTEQGSAPPCTLKPNIGHMLSQKEKVLLQEASSNLSLLINKQG